MRRIGVLVTLAIVFVTAVWWMFLISPKNGQIDDLRDELNVAVDTELRLRAQIDELEAIRQSEVQYLAAIGQLDALIPETPLLEQFIEQIYALSSETGVELQALAPAPPVASETSQLHEIQVSAQIQGEFFEILGFLFGLNDMERLVRVDGISVSSSTDETGRTVLSAGVQMTLFTLADVVPVPEGSTPDGQQSTPDQEASAGEPASEGDLEASGAGT